MIHSELNNYDNKSTHYIVKLSAISKDSNESSSILVDKTLMLVLIFLVLIVIIIVMIIIAAPLGND